MNDADIEMADLQSAANHESSLRRKGICSHGWFQGTTGQPNGPAKCNHCGKQFASVADLMDERAELMA